MMKITYVSLLCCVTCVLQKWLLCVCWYCVL